VLQTQAERAALFDDWKKETGKSYASKGKEEAAFKTWSANLAAAVEQNTAAGVRAFKGLNAFSDLSFAEFKAQYLMPDSNPTALLARTASAPKFSGPSAAHRKLAQSTAPLAFDWRALGKVPPPRDQGGCGSCWSFAAIAAMESKALIDGTSTGPNLSEQQMVDCVNGNTGYYSQGCNGGYSVGASGRAA
jgi:C1A family cysteine protease